MVQVCCPVCGGELTQEASRWYCAAGHSFDVARQGYVNLLTVSQKHARHPGDTRAQVAARRAFLDAGYYAPIAQMLRRLVPLAPGQAVLDAGCGEGYYLDCLGRAYPGAVLWGADISKDAVRYAAVRCPKGHWVTATAAHLPFGDESFDAVLSMFAPTVAEEFHRVLKPGGRFLQVLAGPEHLLALRQLIYPRLLEREKQQHVQYPGFTLQYAQTLEFAFTAAPNEQVQNLLAMTPHYWRISHEGAARVSAVASLSDRAQVVCNCYRRL